MHDQSDIQLLRDYAATGSDAAFRELVTRHTDFVFSAALRQVESPDLAADLAQSVFTDLARKARPVAEKMPMQSSLAGWLHRSTRYAALNHLRDTRRRQSNERQAMEQLLTDTGSAPDWENIRPVLDEALDSLGDDDREALLLRYFKNQDYRAIGLALGTSDDTAQKRVTRAVDRLRDYFSRRNITVGASGLVVLISANAIQAAPAGLAAAISTAAVLTGTAVSTSTVIAATKTIAMTTLQKTLVTAALATAIGAGIFEAHQASQLREQTKSLQQQLTPLAGQIRQLQQERDDSAQKLARLTGDAEQDRKNNSELIKLRGQVATLQSQLNLAGQSAPAVSAGTNDGSSYPADPTQARIDFFKHQLKLHPEWSIPEIQTLNDLDWMNLIKINFGHRSIQDENDIRSALSAIRRQAKLKFASRLQQAVNSYAKDNSGNLPGETAELKSYLDAQKTFQGPFKPGAFTPGSPPPPMFALNQPTDPATLQRYQMLQSGNVGNLRPNQYVMAERSPVDDQYDTLIEIGLNNLFYQGTAQNSADIGWGGTPDLDTMTPDQKKRYDTTLAQQATWNDPASAGSSAAEKEFQKNFLNAMTPEERKKFEQISPPAAP